MKDGALASRIEGDSGLPFAGFVAFIASIMALNALGIDSMLPALPAIGRSVGIATENQQQWIVFSYLLGFGTAQIVWGPLADRYGRKPIMLVCLILYSLLSIGVGFASSFPILLVARLLQGVAASASRVLAVSIVRDCYSGRRMARVMSLSFIVFLAVPILAPSVGQVISWLFGSWRALFFALGIYGAMMAIVCAIFLRETLHPEYRQPLRVASVIAAMRRVVTTRVSIGYTMAAAFTFGCVSGFVSSVQQIFADVFHAPAIFPLLFAGVAGGMGVSAFLNSRFVERYGTRRLSHTTLLGFVLVSLIHVGLAASGHDSLPLFIAMQAAQMFCFGMMGANFNSMAMEPVGDIAGSASSVQGCISTILGAAMGAVVGQSFNGTTIPLSIGFSTLGVLALLAVLWTERGRLFRPQHAAPVEAR